MLFEDEALHCLPQACGILVHDGQSFEFSDQTSIKWQLQRSLCHSPSRHRRVHISVSASRSSSMSRCTLVAITAALVVVLALAAEATVLPPYFSITTETYATVQYQPCSQFKSPNLAGFYGVASAVCRCLRGRDSSTVRCMAVMPHAV
jgi:hypothetical protein